MDGLKTCVGAVVRAVRTESVLINNLFQAMTWLALGFGWWEWSSDQTGQVVALWALVTGAFARQQVTPLTRPRSRRGEDLAVGPGGPGVSPWTLGGPERPEVSGTPGSTTRPGPARVGSASLSASQS